MAKPPSMPRSCGLALRTVRTAKNLEIESLTELLRPHTARFRPRDIKFSSDTLTNAEHSQQTLYYVLDAYAKWSGYPVGLIYLFARLSSELRDGDTLAAKDIASSLRRLANVVDECANPKKLKTLQPVLFPRPGIAERPEEPLDAIAYDTVIRYQQDLPDDHPENAGRPNGDQMKYIDSQQILDDARQVRILLELLSKVPPPLDEQAAPPTVLNS